MSTTRRRRINFWGLALGLSLWGALGSIGAPQAEPTQADDPLNEGKKLLEAGHFIEASNAFNHFKQTAPEDARPYFYSGVALTQAGRLSAAALELSEAVRLAPDRPEYRVFQANVLSRLKQKAHAVEALAIFKKEDDAKSLATAWLQLLADVYFRLEQNDNSLRILNLLGERKPDDARVDHDRGKVYILKGDINLALESFRKSIGKSRDNPAAYFELGKILYQRSELAPSKDAFLEAVRKDGSNPEYLLKLGDACLALGEVGEAIRYLKRAEPSAATFPEIYYALGRAYQRRGDRPKGDEYRKRFEEISSAQRKKDEQTRAVERLIQLGETQMDEGNKAEARALFEQALQADPSRWDAHAYLAEMFLSSGDLEPARQHLVSMEKIDPDSVVGNFLMAKYCTQHRDFGRARAHAEKVKSSRPANSELRNLLGNIYMGLGQEETALREYKAAVRLAPERADFRENLRRLENLKLEVPRSPKKR